ncbi:MAG: UDP-N-acetylglucosamine--N-acetylmuramyl-(pentapeptide) pyrophosphoryl-undecaprenol N-acetylglucosamine transferase [Acidimicrobiales bacterium]
MTRYAVVAGGGTGGHVLLALAVARALVEQGHDPGSIELVGSRRGQEGDLLAGEGFPLTLLPGRGIARRLDAGALLANAGAVVGLARAIRRAAALVARSRPRVVVSVGGYASFPSDLAAVVLRIPLVLVNVDAVPGLVHRIFGRFAAASAVAFPGTPLPRAVVTGTPVRAEIAGVDRSPAAARQARQRLGLPPDRSTVGVVGGSLGARRLNEAASGLAREWAQRADRSLYHVTGRGRGAEVAPPVGGALCYRSVEFERQMALLYQAADVMVCRAGAVTVAELAVAGVPAVLVPLPGAPGDHQTANARALADVGAGELLADGACDAGGLAARLDRLLSDPERLRSMGEAARALGHADAARRVAEVVIGCAR